ncbi:hypothetical protein ACNHYB_12670 [Isoptericola jiangsuensis]|uniref:hypothetical protein n=1 Tax=Isoptericola jiangsuensis TaxID=548579 RepID=UPI003AAA4D6D
MPTPSLTLTPRVEVRPLTAGRSLVTTPVGASFVLDVPAERVLQILDAWTTGQASPALPDGWEAAAAVLRDVLDRDGAFTPAAVAGPDLGDGSPSYDDIDAALPGDLLLSGDPAVVAALQTVARTARPEVTVRAVPADDWQRVVHRAFRTGELLVHVVRGGDDATLVALDRLCADARTPWVALEVTRSVVWLGPFVTPGVGASYEDLADRRTAAAYDAESHRALRSPPWAGTLARRRGTSPTPCAPLSTCWPGRGPPLPVLARPDPTATDPPGTWCGRSPPTAPRPPTRSCRCPPGSSAVRGPTPPATSSTR